MATELRAQPADPNVDVRVVADPGPSGIFVVEPEIAVGHDAVVVVAHRFALSNPRARYTILNRSTGVWDSGAFAYPNAWSGGTSTSLDVSVAYDPNTRGFVATALATHKPTGSFATSYIVASRLDPNSNHANGIGKFSSLYAIDAGRSQMNSYDIPWIAAGQWTPSGREYYCIWRYYELGTDPNEPSDPNKAWPDEGYKYRRSIDGGHTWAGGIVKVSGYPVAGIYCAKPAAYKNRGLFVAYNDVGSKTIRFLYGVDPADPNAVGGVTFVELETECEVSPAGPSFDPPPPPIVVCNADFEQIRDSLPGGLSVGRVPQLTHDPSNAGRMYLVYHDTDTDDPNDKDLNVYIQVLTGSGNQWCVSERAPVGTDDPDLDDDQFMPSVAVDDHGYIHVVYYDDRRYPTQADGDDPNNPPKFDCYYAYSKNGGATWTEVRLDGDDPNDPAVDCLDVPNLKEYIGIDWFGDDVFTAFTGSIPYDPANPPPTHPGVIWSSRIRW